MMISSIFCTAVAYYIMSAGKIGHLKAGYLNHWKQTLVIKERKINLKKNKKEASVLHTVINI